MPLSISTIYLTISGSVASDITRVEVNGSDTTITNQTWSWSGEVPSNETTVTIAAIGPTRTDTRVVEFAKIANPFAIG